MLGKNNTKKKIIIFSIIIFVLIASFMGYILYKNYSTPNIMLKAYLSKNTDGYTLVITNPKTLIFTDFWSIQEHEVKDTREDLMPWISQDFTDKITKVVIYNDIRVNSTSFWFQGMTNLKEVVGLDKIDTSNLEYMAAMFYDCKSIKEIDLSNFKTDKVISMAAMFYNAEKLETVYVNEELWSTQNVIYSANMFKNCYKLTGQNKTTYIETITSDDYARVDKEEKAGYFTAK